MGPHQSALCDGEPHGALPGGGAALTQTAN